MDSKIKKIKICVIGEGEWGKKIQELLNIISRYELIGTINSSTPEDLKNKILNESELWYIAIPSKAQFTYIIRGLSENKHIICETPVCKSSKERKEIYQKLIANHNSNSMFYCNFPFFLDQDFGRLMSGGLIKKAKFFKLKCCGPKFKNEPELAKKFYINQALNLIFNCAAIMEIKNFDKFFVKDDFCGEIHAGNVSFIFEWGYSEYPKLDLNVNGEDYSKSAELVYDKYDQIMPMLISFSDKIRNLDDNFNNISRSVENSDQTLENKLSVSSFITASTAEYFSDFFCLLNGESCNISDTTKLFINGGFGNPEDLF